MNQVNLRVTGLRNVFVRMAVFIFTVTASLPLVSGQAPLVGVFSETLPIRYDECLTRARDTLNAEGYKAEKAAGNAFWGSKGGHHATIICDGTPHADGKIDVHVVTSSNGNGAVAEYKNLTDRLMGRRTSETQPPGGPSVRTRKTQYSTTETIIVDFSGLPGNQQDWVGIFKVGAPDRNYERYQYTQRRTSGFVEWIASSFPPRRV